MQSLPITFDLLRKAIDTANDGLVIAEQEGADTILLYVNAAFERLTGYSREEILYQDCRFLQGSDRDQPARAEIRAAIASGQACRVRLRNYRKDGSMFWNEVSMTPIFSEEENLAYFVGIQRDVTRDVELAQHLRELEKRAGGG